MEWLKNRQKAADYFEFLIADANASKVELFMSQINLGEIYYSTAKDWDIARADNILERMLGLPIETVSVSDEGVLDAARLKSSFKISYADAFAASLAMRLDCPLVTGDPEFLLLARAGLLKVDWVGA
jgi:ribonuclease VapC